MDETETQPATRRTAFPREGTAAAEVEEAARIAGASLPGRRGELAAALARLLLARAPPAYFARVSPADAAATSASLTELIEEPTEGFRVRIRAYAPAKRGAGRRKRVALETAGRDQPFILDSLLELLRVRGHRPVEVLHPIAAVERGPSGEVAGLGPPRADAQLLSVVHIELPGGIAARELEAIEAEAADVLGEAKLVVQDFEPMLEKLREVEARLLEELETTADRSRREEIKETAAFLDWLHRANFVFLGYRAYDVRWAGSGAEIEVRHGSGLGILRDEERSSFARPKALSSLPRESAERILAPRGILVHKASADSRVLRRTRMDYVGVKRFDREGRVLGEDRFQGLFTARAYNDLPSDIPILRRKLEEILERANVVPGSHDHKEMFSIFTSIPKSELFVADTARLAEMIFTVMSASTRRDVRVAYRPDFLERGVSAMVLLPKERFNPEVRLAIQDLLAGELQGTPIDYRLALSDEPMARLHFYFETKPGARPSPPLAALEAKVAQIARAWDDRLLEALERESGGEGAELARRYAKAFPPAYVAMKSPDTAVADIRHVEEVLREGRVEVAVAHSRAGTGRGVSVLKIYRREEPFALSTLMPVLTNLGLHVLDEQIFRIAPAAAGTGAGGGSEIVVYVHSFRVLAPDGEPLRTGAVARNVEDTIPRVLAGEVDDDPLNSLVARVGLDNRQVAVLRAYDAYLRQLGGPWSRRTTHATLCSHARTAALLVRLFEARFDPRLDEPSRRDAQEGARTEIRSALARVGGIAEDQVLRRLENAILATVRTSFFRRDETGRPLPALALKLRCAEVQALPEPRPIYEVFVQSAAVEGVHLRSGKVARGGIRWSSRPDDYRMEILGLMKAQRTKNAIIVPVGAKGGFILKRAPVPPPPEEVRRQYEVFVDSLLDVTDDVVDGKVVHPPGVVVHDEEDPYLVVAADRGTATFSDAANAIAVSRGFWLGDAFASGGSRGYNHKKEGITARGAWECARRHFRELGMDPERETFTVAGIGDMSGDVFGNGLLLSRNAKLLAAFNHAHVFLDPDPDPAASFEERRRLFHMPGSAWNDYAASKISPGGGVWRRDAKEIKLSPRAREVLGTAQETVNGDELVRAVLRMPVDLLFNGGIGTYVKASTESQQDVGDPANDAVRVDGSEVRARIVLEGGNLGATQLGRIEYARADGRINADFIDNSAGVDLSDHEVNLKLLLARPLRRGAIDERGRDEVLRAAAPAVCCQVLRDNHLQGCVLSLEEREGAAALDEHGHLMDELVAAGLLNRALEKVPAERDLVRLRESRMGLTRPQLSVLLAYAKIDAYLKLLASPIAGEPELEPFLVEYFPPDVSTPFAEDVGEHPLRREIAATAAVNAAINSMGIAFFHGTARRTGARFDAVLRAWLAARELCGAQAFHAAMDALYAGGFKDMAAFYGGLARFRAAAGEVVRGILRRGLGARPSRQVIAEYAPRIERLRAARSGEAALLPGPVGTGAGLPEDIERAIRRAGRVAEAMDLAGLLERTGASDGAALRAWEDAGTALLSARLEEEAARVVKATPEDRRTCESLLETARELRRGLARALLESGRAAPLDHPARARATKVLGASSGREPLSVSAFFVVVEELGRAADIAKDP
ncbi:MAG: NAD-glutamate dehydrogenase [Planctomycetes bacterium]|nr:NAD-glutamate dehydrogenase [Planctomycetota bacterium]